MKQFFFFLIAITLWQLPCALLAQTQEDLVLQNIETEKTRTLRHNKMLKVTTVDDCEVLGRLIGVDSNLLYLNAGNVPVKEIKSIRIHYLGTRIGGVALTTIGTATILVGGYFAVSQDSTSYPFNILIGGALAAIGVTIDVLGVSMAQITEDFHLQGRRVWIFRFEES